MYPLDILYIRPKIRRMVDFILKEDAGDFVSDEVCGLDGVVGGIEEIGLERAGCDGELEVAASFHICVADGAAPHLDGVGGHGIFG